jgi:hypothetical protein
MFVRGPNPIWFFNNLTGQPVDDTYYAFYLTNTLPYVPQAVYEDPEGTIPWSDPVQFQPSGGLPNNVFFNPELVYRIEIRQGPDQTFPLIDVVENYSVDGEGGSESGTPLITAENMVTNPQFADIFFSSPVTITTSGTTLIAPGWSLITTGSGSTTIAQTAQPGNANNVGNPPYFLTFSSSGWSSVILAQTFTNNGAIFGGGAAALYFEAFSVSTPQNLSVIYSPSVGTVTTLFPPSGGSGAIPVGGFQQFSNAVDIPGSTNSDTGEAAFVQIQFVLPNAGSIALTNIQITGQSVPLPSNYMQSQNPIFAELSYERVVDHEFHVYRDSLVTEPKSSLLAGWNFALNPWQFTTTTVTNVAINQYTADQTVVIQQNYVAASTGNNVAVGQGTDAENFPFIVKAITSTNQFAILQYISPLTIAPYWNQILSAMVNVSADANINFKMRLIYQNALPSAISQTEPISSWTANSDPTFSSAWGVIKPLNDPVYTITTTDQNFAFDKFQLPASTNDNMTLAIVVYTVGSQTVNNQIYFNRISLVPNAFAIDVNTETFDESLRKCQFYYESSYPLYTLPGTNTYSGCLLARGGIFFNGSIEQSFLASFYLPFQQAKGIPPVIVGSSTITFYSPQTGASNNVSISIRRNATTFPTTSGGSNPRDLSFSGNFSYTAPTAYVAYHGAQINCSNTSTAVLTVTAGGTNAADESTIEFHYTVDARLGL